MTGFESHELLGSSADVPTKKINTETGKTHRNVSGQHFPDQQGKERRMIDPIGGKLTDESRRHCRNPSSSLPSSQRHRSPAASHPHSDRGDGHRRLSPPRRPRSI